MGLEGVSRQYRHRTTSLLAAQEQAATEVEPEEVQIVEDYEVVEADAAEGTFAE